MIRKALIIGSPDEGRDRLPGVLQDMQNWHAYLSSTRGGAWFSNEITIIESPTPDALNSAIKELNTADYSFVTFSGHGRALSYGKTMIGINPREEMDSASLLTRASRQTVVVDCCRRFPQLEHAKSLIEARNIRTDSFVDRYAHRKAFEKYLEASDPGQIVLYSCSPNETAGESEQRGGYYTSALIQAGTKGNLPSPGVLSVREAHVHAQSAVKTRTGQKQNPTGEFPRSKNIFPFSVSL